MTILSGFCIIQIMLYKNLGINVVRNLTLPQKRIIIPLVAGTLGALLLTTIYFGLVSWAESPAHALLFFWQDRWVVLPIILGFGLQAALYSILKWKLFLPLDFQKPGIAMTSRGSDVSVGASGTTSTIAMAACCAHHVTDVLPILGLTAAATFLAKYRLPLMVVGLGTTIVGIAYMVVQIFRERRKAFHYDMTFLNSKEIP